MKDNDWITRTIIAGVIVLAISVGGIAYGIHKHNQSLKFVGKPLSNTSNNASCISVDQAASDEGQTGCVQFTGYAYTSDSGQMYLDQSTSAPYGFSAYIPAGSSFGPSLLNQYSGQSIDVTGSIINYNGEPEIEVTSASQITLAQ